jgi:intracellular multiplication protein IcmP
MMNNRMQVQRGSSEDSMMAFGLIIAVAIGGGWFLWYKYHPQIAAGVIVAEHWQMRFTEAFTDRYQTLDAQALALDPSDVTAQTLYRLCHLVGLFFRIPTTALIAALAVLCLTRSAPSQFTRSLDLDRLIGVQSKVFRTLAVVAGRKLKPVPLRQGQVTPLDPALHVREWIDRHARDADGCYDEDRARQELAAQLGPIWSGPERATPVIRCLFAAFALQAAREREAAMDLLGDIAGSLPRDKEEGPEGPRAPLDIPPAIVARADVALAKRVSRVCRDVAAKHGFATTALMSVLCEARRQAGVLAPAQVNFVKFIDRRLWYALHSLGFPSGPNNMDGPMPNPRVEAIGARDHWAAECVAGRPLLVPAIDRAVLSIRVALSKVDPERTNQEAP